MVYRAHRGERSFAVKIQRSGVSNLAGDAALRFRREGAILACLRHPGLPAILELGEVGGRPYIVQELVEGRTLSQQLEDGPLSTAGVVAIGKRLAGALAEVHRSGTVHCDVKPDNILIDDAGSARLIDFGFAVRLGMQRAGDEVVGTLLYAAPEQTGMLKRPLDGRSDWYALGVVLFECATGSLPFESQDAGELIRLHAVQAPPDPRDRNPGISPGLAAVLLKMLSKDPDDRYQSRDGLVGDLERLDELDEIIEAGQEPALAVADRPAKTFIEPVLVGRGPALDQLRYYWDRACAGRGSFVVVHGAPGFGKTRVLREMMLRVRSTGGVVLPGATNDDAMPFAPLREAVERELRQAAHRDEPEELAARVREAAGDAAPLLRRLSPDLARLLGDVPDSPGLEEVRDQFYDAVAHFLVRYATAVGGAMLLIDDAQRLDDGSRQILHRMAALMREAPLLVVAGLRSGSDASVEVDTFFEEMGTGLSHRLELGPLDDEAVARLIAAQLGDVEATLEFGPRLSTRCAGSPMAAVELVRATLEAGLLRPTWGTWVLDEQGLENLDLPTELRDLVVRRVERLTATTRSILTAAAAIGSRFDAHLLPEVCETESHDWHVALGEGLRARVVEQEEGGQYRFVHNDIRDSLIGALDSDQERALHQRIAEVLDAEEYDDADHLYAVARHYNLGDVDDDPERVVAANLAAAQGARAEYAHEEAYGFLEVARSCAERAVVELPDGFRETMAEIAARTGRLAEAIQHFEQALDSTTTPLQRARLQAKLAHTHVANFHMGDAWRAVSAGFVELGSPFPRWRPWQWFTTGVMWCRGLLRDRLGVGHAEGEARERHEIFVQLCEYGAIQGYFDSRLVLMAQLVARAYHHATQLGPSPELVTVYNQLAVGFAAAGMRRFAGWYSDRAEAVAEGLGDRLVLARCRLYGGFVAHLSGESVLAEQRMAAALEEHGRWLDSMHYVDGSGDHVFNLVLRGYFREALSWVERQLPRLTFTSGGVRKKQGNPWGGPILVALGRTNEGADLLDRTRDFVEAAPRSERYLWAELLSYRILFQLELGDCGPMVDRAIEEHRALGLTPLSIQFHCRSFYVFQVYARMEQAMRAADGERDAALGRLAQAVRELHRTSLIPSLKAHALVAEAALRRLRGDEDRAEVLLHRAETVARQIDSPWVLYEAARQRAFLLSGQGHRVAADREARTALGIAGDHGWVYRARKVRAEFDIGHTSRLTISASPSRSLRETSHAGVLRLRRQLDALVQVSTAAATVLDPDSQARSALDEIVRILGAERAFLFHLDEGDGGLRFQVGRDAEGDDLDEPTGFSTTVLERVQNSCQPMVLSGAQEGAVIGSESVVAHDLRSILAAPLMVRDRLVGVIYLDNRLARGVFTEDDTEILLALGTHIGIALETARAAQLEIRVEAETQKRRLAESLREMIQALSSTLDLDEVLERLLTAVTQVMPHDRASVFLVQGDQLHRVAPRDVLEDSQVPGLRVDLSADTVLSEVVEAREPVLIRDRLRDARDSVVITSPFRSLLGVPLISMDRAAGVLVLERREPDSYSASDAEIALTFAGQAGVAIENARLFGEVRRLATTDALTGLLNRRQFFAQAEREVSRWKRYGGRLAAAMIDVDHFKKVNDTHGHAVGDEVLTEIARRCHEEVRDVDILGRYGGEEFAVLLPDTGRTEARDHFAERLRKRIGGEPVSTQKGPITVTVSVGIAAADRGTSDLGALLERADVALYEAKEGGRDRVVAAEDHGGHPGGAEGEDGKDD